MIIEGSFSKVYQSLCKSYYVLFIQLQEFPKNENWTFKGEHKRGKSDEDVKILQFCTCLIYQIPKNIGYTFNNVEDLIIENSSIKSITKFDLKQFKNLKHFVVVSSGIELTPGDLLEYTKNIENITFNDNRLKFIGPNLLDGLVHLKTANFLNNVNINCYYGPGYSKAITLEQLKDQIKKLCKPQEADDV